uniref:Uncharacterized protein n=1 Tax=Anopheles culicifacies TaxID=139723 RepID=A0A182MKF0_9DIPT
MSMKKNGPCVMDGSGESFLANNHHQHSGAVLAGTGGGLQSASLVHLDQEDMSSSSFSSASRASLELGQSSSNTGSPTASYGENLLPFQGDSSVQWRNNLKVEMAASWFSEDSSTF